MTEGIATTTPTATMAGAIHQGSLKVCSQPGKLFHSSSGNVTGASGQPDGQADAHHAERFERRADRAHRNRRAARFQHRRSNNQRQRPCRERICRGVRRSRLGSFSENPGEAPSSNIIRRQNQTDGSHPIR